MNAEQSIFGYFSDSLTDGGLAKITYYGRSFSGAEFRELALRFGGYLIEEGVAPGTVAVMLPNIPEALIAVYGANAVGSTVNLLNPRIPTRSLEKLLLRTDTKLIVLFDFLYAKHKKMLKRLGIKTVLCSLNAYKPAHRMAYLAERAVFVGATFFEATLGVDPCKPRVSDGNGIAVYIHSGGTTGEPKTVCLQDKALNNLARAVLDTVHPEASYSPQTDSMLMMLPVFHGFGLGVCVHTIMCAFRVVLEPRFKAKEAIALIEREKVTHLAGVPSMFRKMLKEPSFDGEYLKSVTEAFCGGDGLPMAIKEEFDRILQKNGSSAELLEGYGLSETVSVVTVGENGKTKLKSQGTPLKGNRVKIVDEHGKTLPPHAIGEIRVSTGSLMSGYLDDDELTSKVIAREDDGEWLSTGDVGYMDEEGFLFYKERAKRSIKIAAINIFPSEIERVVGSLGVGACCAVRCRDSYGKPMIALYVERANRSEIFVENKIKRAVARDISPYAVPRKIIFVDKIARTDVGKTDYVYYENSN